ncbi:hypothetical protein D3C72_2183240 [compost metagenome]
MAAPEVASVPANGLAQPAMLGAKPPVTISPTSPSARSRKYAAMRERSRPSSSPVCMDPMSTRFLSVVKPKSSGASRCGYRSAPGAGGVEAEGVGVAVGEEYMASRGE